MDWNRFGTWIEKKGVKMSPELDKNDYGNKLFKQFRKENPDVTIDESIVPKIRKHLGRTRDARIEDFKKGNATFLLNGQEIQGESGDYSKFMGRVEENEKSKNPSVTKLSHKICEATKGNGKFAAKAHSIIITSEKLVVKK